MGTLQDKQVRLESLLRELGPLLVAYSGGVDSAYLAWSAYRALDNKMIAVLADSPSLSRHHLREAVTFAKEHRIPLEIIQTSEMENVEYVKNDMLRCFHCKTELFGKMDEAKKRLGFRHLAYGMNLDDRGDFRPGQKAALQHGVLAPLVEAGLAKSDVRELAHEAGLKVWDKPASACLSSRIAYGTPVTPEALTRIEEAEAYLRQMGLTQFRVRDHDGLARIEIAPEELEKVLSPAILQVLVSTFKFLGFTYVTLDCEGYRSGSMNVVLSRENISLAHAPSLS